MKQYKVPGQTTSPFTSCCSLGLDVFLLGKLIVHTASNTGLSFSPCRGTQHTQADYYDWFGNKEGKGIKEAWGRLVITQKYGLNAEQMIESHSQCLSLTSISAELLSRFFNIHR